MKRGLPSKVEINFMAWLPVKYAGGSNLSLEYGNVEKNTVSNRDNEE